MSAFTPKPPKPSKPCPVTTALRHAEIQIPGTKYRMHVMFTSGVTLVGVPGRRLVDGTISLTQVNGDVDFVRLTSVVAARIEWENS